MRKLFSSIFILLSVASCMHKQTLTEQLHATFSNHLKQIDSAATLDSVHVFFNVPVTQRLVTIIDDSSYVREYTRIKSQLTNARQKNAKDSIEFYQYEISYMEKEIDSVSKSIGQGDTVHSYGLLLGCAYHLKKNNKAKTDSTILFIDSTSVIRYTEYMDSALSRTSKMLN